MAPLDFDIGFQRESDRTLRNFTSDATLGRKSKQTPVTYLQLYTIIYYMYGVYFSQLNVPFFSRSQIKRTLLYSSETP